LVHLAGLEAASICPLGDRCCYIAGMAQTANVILCATVMTVLWSLVGLPIAARVSAPLLSYFLAPPFGWAVSSTLTLPLLAFVGISRVSVAAVTAVLAVAALAVLWAGRHRYGDSGPSRGPVIAIAATGLLALAPLAAILPKESVEGVRLAVPIFDHSKIAMIDEMARSGVPPSNPFFHETGAPSRLSYYYLWYFSAACMAKLTGVSGWEADAAQTWFTAWSSLMVVVGFALWLGGRVSAGLFAVAIAATASARWVLEWVLGEASVHPLIRWATGFGGWLFQVSWAPQHVASAMLVVLACYSISQLPHRRDPVLVLILSLVAAAAFQSSVWAGGFAFAISAAAIGIKILWQLPGPSRGPFLARAGIAALIATGLVAPLLYDQWTITAMRDGTSPLAIAPLPVLGDVFSELVRTIFDAPAFWFVYLPVELPASYVAGVIALVAMLRHKTAGNDDRPHVIQAFTLLLAGSLLCSALLIGDVGGNNDLAWRSALPAILLLICFAAIGLAQWTATRRRLPAALAVAGIAIGLPEGFAQIGINLSGKPSASEAAFAKSSALWAAVRRHTEINARIGNNPMFLGDMTPWPVNISWALLADRRSCYAGYNLGVPFAPVSAGRREAIEKLFLRVFDGRPAPDDVQELAERHGCDVVLVTPHDQAWSNDPFRSSNHYGLVEEQPDEWRIYRKITP
jgi:hypothetical protein